MLDVKHQLRNINYETRRGWFQGMWEVLFACYLFADFFSVAVFVFFWEYFPMFQHGIFPRGGVFFEDSFGS